MVIRKLISKLLGCDDPSCCGLKLGLEALDVDPDNLNDSELPAIIQYIYVDSDYDLMAVFSYLTDPDNASTIDSWIVSDNIINPMVKCLLDLFGDFEMANGELVSTLEG